MSVVKSSSENALVEMSAQMTAFVAKTDSRRDLDEILNNICTKYEHPFGTVTKKRNGAYLGGGYHGGQQTEYFEQIEYQACRFCGKDTSSKKLKL
jgi:hypothetical protein